MADRRGGCSLLLVGFVLGWGFAVLTRSDPAPPVGPPPNVYEAPATELRDRRDPVIAAAPVEAAPAVITPEPAESATPLEDASPSDAMDVAQLDPQPVERAPLVSDRDIRRQMIEQSLSSYSGSCPCPYNIDRAGRSCGARSAYSRPGGASPLCYPSDISDAQVQSFRSRQN
jgi:hypothetical protein